MSDQKPILIYCYDAYCGWCYGFSSVIKKIAEDYADKLQFEVVSGGMISAENPVPIKAIAGYIASAYKQVEATTGCRFGDDFLWHIMNPDESDWYIHSEKAAIALCIIKQMMPERGLAFATDLQYALNFEGRDLTDNEAYRHLAITYNISTELFFKALKDESFRQMAAEEFEMVRKLGVSGFPALLLQIPEGKTFWISNGFTPYHQVSERIQKILSPLTH
jgi:putative protein-disulfide isomerase